MASPTARLRRRLQSQIGTLAVDIQHEIIAAFDKLSGLVDEAALAALVQQAGFGAGALTDEMLAEAFGKLRVTVQQTLREGAEAAARAIPGVNPAAVFDVLNPNVITAAQALDTKVMKTLTDATREAFRVTVEQGLIDGLGPRQIARQVRNTIGMAPNQVRAVANFERMLREGDAEAFTRTLRDRRFDATLRKAFAGEGLSASQIKTMTDAYRRRMIAFNAEVNARTATLDALRAGQRLSWERAVDLGVVDRSRLMKRRSAVMDARVRPEHAAINGQVRHIDEPYSNGEMISGDRSFNCRCIDVYSQAQATA